MADHPDLEAEQAYFDQVRRHLAIMQRRAEEMIRIGDRAVRDEDTVDARVVMAHLEKRVEAVSADTGPLCFGRIDTDDPQRCVFRRMVVAESWRRHVARLGADPGTEPTFSAGIKANRDFTRLINRMWPRLTAADLLSTLYRSPKRLAEAADGHLNGDEQAALRRTLRPPVDDL